MSDFTDDAEGQWAEALADGSVADPLLPEPAVEAARAALLRGPPDGLDDEFGEGCVTSNPGTARKGAVRALRAALDTGTLITVPEDEQGRRELVERAARAIADEKVGRFFWTMLSEATRLEFRCQATAVLQALGLLPEQ